MRGTRGQKAKASALKGLIKAEDAQHGVGTCRNKQTAVVVAVTKTCAATIRHFECLFLGWFVISVCHVFWFLWWCYFPGHGAQCHNTGHGISRVWTRALQTEPALPAKWPLFKQSQRKASGHCRRRRLLRSSSSSSSSGRRGTDLFYIPGLDFTATTAAK